MSSSTLAAISLAEVTDQLNRYGSFLHGDHVEAIRALLEALEAGLKGTLSPHYHLSAMDPGVGKSLSVAAFLRVWKAQGFAPSSSVLIGLSRLEEIRSYRRQAGLDQEDVAVLTSDPDYNALGLPRERHGEARVMFTTQQMIEKRTRGGSFAERSEFHFQGRPRTLRIWDESLVPAEQLILQVDDVGALPGALRRQAPVLARNVEALLRRLWELSDGERFVLPEGFANPPVHPRSLKGSEASPATFEALTRMAGQEVTAVHTEALGTQLVGVGQPLPEDFPPVVILDASGRVRSTYDIWEKNGGPLRRLPTSTKDYGNLRVHLWERAVGKAAMRAPGAIEDVVKGVAQAISEAPAADWLIVHYKDQPVDQLLPKAVRDGLEARLRFLTWGMHHGTNAFAHCTRVVLIGQLTYGNVGYRALAVACGAPINDDEAQHEIKEGEYRHHLLQALTRASARRTKNGLAGTCTAYIIASPTVGTSALVSQVFPGCTVERWSPDVPAVGGRAGQLMALLEDARAQRITELRKKDLRNALGLLPPNFSRLLKQQEVERYMERRGMRNEGSKIILPPGFDPYHGDGFTVDQLAKVG